MKRKLLFILALLLFVSGAWAQSTITVYATNTANWSKMSIHYWGNGETSWPGTAMENFYTDNSGKKYYRATIPAGVSGILFTNGANSFTKQTGDITSNIADGAWWEVNSTISDGKYGVDYIGLIPHGNCGTSGHESDVTWVLLGTSPNYALIISGTGAMKNNQPWSSYLSGITNVVIKDGVTSIGDYAFHVCSNLLSVTIPSSVTSIGDYAFCATGLTSIFIPASVTSIGKSAFTECSDLQSITFEGESKLETIGDNAFLVCRNANLTSVTIPASVTTIGTSAFNGCSSLTSFAIEEGSKLERIGDEAFSGCGHLTSLTIPASVTSIGDRAFTNCMGLTISLNSNPTIGTIALDDVEAVTMNLAVKKADEGEYWTTFYNENYNFQISDAGGQNTQIFKAALSGTKLTLTELGDDSGEDKIITKDKAVILKSTASPMVFTLTKSNSSNSFDGNSLLGVSSATGLTADGTHFVLNKGSNGVGFYRMTSGKIIGVGKAYLTYSGALAREFFGIDETTNISTTNCTDYTDKADAWYTIDGRRLQDKPNTKGLYIVNGKKTVIK